MLRITDCSTPNSQIFKLEGTLRGPWVAELRQVWTAQGGHPSISCKIDLTYVTFVDDDGRDLLMEMRRAGTVLEGASPFLRQLLDGKDGLHNQSGRKI